MCVLQLWVPIDCKGGARRESSDDSGYCQADKDYEDDPDREPDALGGEEAMV